MPKATVVRLRGTTRSQIDQAITRSPLARMPASARDTLVTNARVVHLRSREYFIRHGAPARVGLVVTGFARAVGSTSDGRELTFAWGHPGVILGLGLLVVPMEDNLSWQAVNDVTLLEFHADAVRRLGHDDAGVAWAMAEHLGAWLRKALSDLLLYAYGDLRARVATRLLELACNSPADGPLIASVTQQDLAQAVGASRPSVARVLKELRDQGAVRPLSRGILVERPEVLAAALDQPPALSSRLQPSRE